MYHVSVPIINREVERMGKEKILNNLKNFDAKRVFLAIGTYIVSENDFEKELKKLQDNCNYFHSHGLEVGVWLWTFWVAGNKDYQRMVGFTGRASNSSVCPSDDNFVSFAENYIAKLAKTGVDIILFDDDYRYGWQDMGMGCFCPNHINYAKKLLGEEFDRETFANNVLKGGKSKYRDAYIEANGHFLKEFAKKMRKAVDSVNPDVRLGVCSCMSQWDFDGAASDELSRILAGNTKPFLRLCGAPYWAVDINFGFYGCRLADVIELERLEHSWSGNNIEIVSEADSYPRPRTNCPANYLEIFDTALRADGNFDGILKYGIDYISNPDYERGYEIRHVKNKPIYESIEKHFDGKTACGVRVYEKMSKFADYTIPKGVEMSSRIQNIFFPISSKMLSASSIPSVYEGLGVAGIAFGDNVDEVSEEAMKNGLIIDIKAAEILMRKGIDVGIESVGEQEIVLKEHFISDNEFVNLRCNAYETKLNKDAEVISEFYVQPSDIGCSSISNTEDEIINGAYIYENKNGYKFLVYTFDAYFNGEGIYRSYARSKQIRDSLSKFGAKLPAYSYGNPDLYIMAKKDSNSMSVGLWNIFADSVIEPTVELDKNYSKIAFINGNGKLEGNIVKLSEIPPFGFVGFEVE